MKTKMVNLGARPHRKARRGSLGKGGRHSAPEYDNV
jgi:hypothetical protein